MTATAALQSLKDRHRTTWAAGDYGAVADALVLEIGERIVERVAPGPESEVLDVATGTGSAADPGRLRRGPRRSASTCAGDLLDARRRRAATRASTSSGSRATPRTSRSPTGASTRAVDPRRAVHAAPRGRPRASSSASAGPAGRSPLAQLDRRRATSGASSRRSRRTCRRCPRARRRRRCGATRATSSELFAGAVASLEFERSTVDFEHDSPEAFIAFMADNYGPLVMARNGSPRRAAGRTCAAT